MLLRVGIYLALFGLVFSTTANATGYIHHISESEACSFIEQKIRFDPPIFHNGQRIEFAVIRSVYIYQVNPARGSFTRTDQQIYIYTGNNPDDSIVRISGTTNPEHLVEHFPILNHYDLSELRNYTARLAEKLLCLEFGQAINAARNHEFGFHGCGQD